jgi:hypothetical protein
MIMPDNIENSAAADAPATDSAAATTSPIDTAAPEAQLKGDEAALAALDRGIEESSPEPRAEVPQAATTEKPVAGADPAKPQGGEKPAEQKPPADAAKPGAKPADKKLEPDPEVEAEIKALGLQVKGAERFRKMASEIKAFAPIKEALEKAGIKDAATFQAAMPQLVQRSRDLDDMVGMVSETGATPEMYTAMLDYLAASTKAVKGDPAAAQLCYDRTLKELAVWAKLLGKEVPGIVDPLAAHPDLQKEVEAGDLTRERALEIAQSRSAGTLLRGRIARDEQNTAAQQAQVAGKSALNTLEAKLKAADPDYLRKREFFLPAVRRIVAKYPPDQWAAEAERAYTEIPALPPVQAAPAPAPRPPPGPVRGGARMQVAEVPKDPMEALEMGIAAAGGG